MIHYYEHFQHFMKKIQGSCLLHHMDLHVTVKLLHKYEVHSAL